MNEAVRTEQAGPMRAAGFEFDVEAQFRPRVPFDPHSTYTNRAASAGEEGYTAPPAATPARRWGAAKPPDTIPRHSDHGDKL